jgi:hypothetical protein
MALLWQMKVIYRQAVVSATIGYALLIPVFIVISHAVSLFQPRTMLYFSAFASAGWLTGILR